MSLVFSLLQKDYIILAADHRHTRGDLDGTYKNDKGIKTLEILNGRGVLGFAGQDFCERIIFPAKQKGLLDNQPDLLSAASALSEFAQKTYASVLDQPEPPAVQILLAAFQRNEEESAATSVLLQSHFFNLNPVSYPGRNFDVIGKSRHGALYGLHRFGFRELPLDAALRLSALVLFEICECDTTTGGQPQIYLIRRGELCLKLENEVPSLVRWAEGVGKRFQAMIMTGATE